MNAITLTIGAETQTLQQWGFTNLTMRLRNRTPSMIALELAGGDPTQPALVPYGGQAVAQITMGDGSIYTFVGVRRAYNAKAHPESWSTKMIFEDVLSRLDFTTFKHYWSMSNGAGGVVNTYFSRINLFQDISAGPDQLWTYLTADNQLRQIVNFAQEICGINVQIGEVDPVWNMPIIAMRSVSCLAAIQQVLKPMPDMLMKLDYSTTLAGNPAPTISFIARQNAASVMLPFSGTDAYGRSHTQSEITPRPDLQAPEVILEYQISTTINSATTNALVTDVYPPGATGLREQSLNAAIDLRGPTATNLKGTLKAVAVDPTTTAFWKEHKPDLNDPNIVFDATTPIVDTTINGGSGHPDGISIIDEAGETVSLADFPNMLVSGQPAAWMMASPAVPVTAPAVTIRATLKYVKNFPTSGTPFKSEAHDKAVVEVRLRLTNCPAGTDPGTTFTGVGSYSPPDPVPIHLAYFMWCSINNVPVNWVGGVATPPAVAPPILDPENFQWEGTHEIAENTVYSIITPWQTLNLQGGNPDWLTMNAVIYSVDIDFFSGKTVIQFGAFKHMQPAEYFEMVTAFRLRQIWDNPQLRNTGQSGSSGAADMGNSSPRENTTHGPPQASLGTFIAPQVGEDTGNNAIQFDAASNGGQIFIQTITTAGAVDTTQPQVQLSNSDLGSVDSVGRIAKWRQIQICDSSGSPMQAWIAMTEPEDI